MICALLSLVSVFVYYDARFASMFGYGPVFACYDMRFIDFDLMWFGCRFAAGLCGVLVFVYCGEHASLTRIGRYVVVCPPPCFVMSRSSSAIMSDIY